jgi:hypothetical protein
MSKLKRPPTEAPYVLVGAFRRSATGFVAETFDLFRKVFVQEIGLFEAMPLRHGTLLSMRGRRERYRAISSQTKATGGAVMLEVCA